MVIAGSTANPEGVSGSGGNSAVKEAFRTPAVQRAIQRLRTKNANLLDLAGGSVLAHDMYEYFVKPIFKNALAAGDQQLMQLHAGGPTTRNGRSFGHPVYTWFMHAAATRCVDDYLKTHIRNILDSDDIKKFSEYLNRNHPADGGYGYLKRKFSQRIQHYYIINRLQEIDNFKKNHNNLNAITNIAGVLNDFQDAVAMKSENVKPKMYRLQHPAYVAQITL